jgi:hypothetical protein
METFAGLGLTDGGLAHSRPPGEFALRPSAVFAQLLYP